MNDREAQEALAIGEILGLDITVQKTADDNVRLMVFDGINAPRRITRFPVFTERYGTLEAASAGRAALTAELEMDAATAAAIADSTLATAAAFEGQRVAPISALPDTANRVRHALRLALEEASDPLRERRLRDALIDVEAFVPDDLVPAPGDAPTRDVLGLVGEAQTAAIVAITGVHGWRAQGGVPAAIGQADRALRTAISNQAGYTASGAPAMFLGLFATGIVTVIALVVALVSSTGLDAVVAAAVGGIVAAVVVLGPAARLASAYAPADYLDRSTPRGRRAHRVMAVVWQLPAIAAAAGGAAGFAIAAVLPP
jgi:hypothetical protein